MTIIRPDSESDRIQQAISDATAPFLEKAGGRALTEYQGRPIDFMVDVLGVTRESLVWSEAGEEYKGHKWVGTKDPLVRVMDAIAEWRPVGVEAGLGVGKSFTAAALALYVLGTYPKSHVLITASRAWQTNKIFANVYDLWPAFQRTFPQARIMGGGNTGKHEIRMSEGASSDWIGWSEVVRIDAEGRLAGGAQGQHREYQLIIVDEMAVVDPRATDAYIATSSSDKNCLLGLGNPDFVHDPLHEFCLMDTTEHVQISVHDYPNVVLGAELVPGATTRKGLAQLEAKFKDNPAMFDSRIHGISPDVSEGIALNYDPKRHKVRWTREETRERIMDGWPVLVGIDYGSWRWSAIIALVDPDGRVVIVEELWSQKEDTQTRMQRLHDTLDFLGVGPKQVRIWGDQDKPQNTIDANAALKRIESPYHVRQADKRAVRGARNTNIAYRMACVEVLNGLLARDHLIFSEELGAGLEWRKGASTQSPGRPMDGSRLFWELVHWRYPPPKTDGTQKQDPDDGTADGADAIAALRYLAMGHRERMGANSPEEEVDRIRHEIQRATDLARAVPLPRTMRDLPRDERDRDNGLERYSAMKRIEDRGKYPRLTRKQERTIEAAYHRRQRERERRDREREERAKERKGPDLSGLDALMDEIDRAGLSDDEAIERIFGSAEDPKT